MKRIALITGATSGFGKAIAEKLAHQQFDLIITGRRNDRLQLLKTNLEKSHGISVLPLCFDVRDASATKNLLSTLPENWSDIDVLVNNAGLASGLDRVQDAILEDWDRMIDTNVKGLLYVSKAIIPGMVARSKGHIINIGSTAGKEVYEKGSVYCASKHAVDAITKGMRIDLLGTGVKVTQVAPGAAETEFSEVRLRGDKERAKALYNGYQPLTAEDIADIVSYVINLPAHVCINDLVVTSSAQANSFYIHREH